MKRSFRPSTPADAPAITELFAQANLRPNADPQALHWKYWQERADWPGPRSFVLTRGNDLIAHGALILGTFAWAARRETMGHVIDWVARRGEVGAGVALMKHIGQQVGSLLAIGGSADTLRILPYIGFRSAGLATAYVRPLFPLRMLRGMQRSDWRKLARVARGVAWKLAAPVARDAQWRARRIESNADLNKLVSVVPHPSVGATVTERGVEAFRYVLSCPMVAMRLYALEQAGQLRGYFLLASAPGQVRIADCWVESAELTDWQALLLCAVDEASHDPQAAEVVIWASDPLLGGALSLCGFHARGESLVRVRSSRGDPDPPTPLRVQMLDNDAAFIHEGSREFWA
jgi:hypothetical protein